MRLPVRVGLVGGFGFGETHRRNLRQLKRKGVASLVGVADPIVARRSAATEEDEVTWFESVSELLENRACDLVIVASPIHTHVENAEVAMRAGAAVYLEKPPAASFGDFWRLVSLSRSSHRPCQVGFQALGSNALPRLAELTGANTLGRVRLVAGHATWRRTREYFDRAVWSGRRRLGDLPVADGVATNALAHCVAQALCVTGVESVDEITEIQTELYKANRENETDDTAWLRVDMRNLPPVSCALTLCGAEPDSLPVVDVLCDYGRIRLEYTTDRIVIDDGWGRRSECFSRLDLLENLIAHLNDGDTLASPLIGAAPYMAVLQAIQEEEPKPIDVHARVEGQGSGAHPVIDDIGYWVEQAALSGTGFAESGAPWGDRKFINTVRRN